LEARKGCWDDMGRTITEVRLVVSYRIETKDEMDTITELVDDDPAVREVRRHNRLHVDVKEFQQIAPGAGRPQDVINSEYEKFRPDIWVFLWWRSAGHDAGWGMTAMVEELELAHRLADEHGTRVWQYWKRTDNMDPELQRVWGQVKHKAYVCKFADTRDLRKQFRAHLIKDLLDRGAKCIDASTLKDQLRRASAEVRNYPTTLRCGHRFERPEVQEILDRIDRSESSSTVILGARGSGKSALVAELCRALEQQGTTYVAINADNLDNASKPADLADRLGIPLDLRGALGSLAVSQPVVLIVDQLDTVARLPQSPACLKLLLTLIASMGETTNVHIVSSCCLFDFQHDTRLSAIKATARLIELGPVQWDSVAVVLKRSGHDPETMPGHMRELLCMPFNLDVFLGCAKPGDICASTHALIDKLWDVRVQSSSARGLLLELPDQMIRQESLWLPKAAFDDRPELVESLVEADILRYTEDGQRVGFRHAAHFEHALARGVAADRRSLAELIRQNQHGLFIRPKLLRLLEYLRSIYPVRYARELPKLKASSLRRHITDLLVEYLGHQAEPVDEEVEFMWSYLDTDPELVLRAVAGSRGWFERLYREPRFWDMMKGEPKAAAHCAAVLRHAVRLMPAQVIELLGLFWLSDSKYDSLSLWVLLGLREWDKQRIDLAADIVRRSDWGRFPALIEQVAQCAPELMPQVLRARLERQLAVAPSQGNQDDLQRFLANIIQEGCYSSDLTDAARKYPAAFLREVWPWLRRVADRLADEAHEFVTGYRQDRLLRMTQPGTSLLDMLQAAVGSLAASDPAAFRDFVGDNKDSDVAVVHRLIAVGLEVLASQEPSVVLDYLAEDQRRLVLGHSTSDVQHRVSRGLIGAVFPHLSPDARMKLEQAIRQFRCYKACRLDWSPKERWQRSIWQRQDVLSLLQAIPDNLISPEVKRFRAQEERALQVTADRDIAMQSVVRVGARMNAEEMQRAADEHILACLRQYPDGTKRGPVSVPLHRRGGAWELAGELTKLITEQPRRAHRLLKRLEPGRFESYAAAILAGLQSAGTEARKLEVLVAELDSRGFHSSLFRDSVASVLEMAAANEGLTDDAIACLKRWLNEAPEPGGLDAEEEAAEVGESILFNYGYTVFPRVGGRGSIMSAIAAGYLHRRPSAETQWLHFLDRLGARETSPDVWGNVIQHLLMTDPVPAVFALITRLFDACPGVLRHPLAPHMIRHCINQDAPCDVVHGWLARLKNNCGFCRQARGELLLVCYTKWRDQLTYRLIQESLAEEACLRGLAYAAGHLWQEPVCRKVACDIMVQAARSADESIHNAVEAFFRRNHRHLKETGLNLLAPRIIEQVRNNTELLLRVAPDLIEILGPHAEKWPEPVGKTCNAIVDAVRQQAESGAVDRLSLVAGELVNVAVTLHRKHSYREQGLDLFEALLALNLREVRDALHILDNEAST